MLAVLSGDGTSMTVYVIIHTKVDDTENHHREIVPKIMEAVERYGGRRIALGHGEQLRVHEGEPPNANRAVIHEFPDHESVDHWVEEIKARRDELRTLGELSVVSVPAI
jgi:uncharacterized protein (DUF1330 family)